MRKYRGVLALALLCAAALPPAHAAPGVLGTTAKNVTIDGGAIDDRFQLAASPRREKHCRDIATGNSGAAKEKSYKDCLKTWR